MKLSVRTRRRINHVVLSISLAIWIILLINPGNMMTVHHCLVSDSGPSSTSLRMLLAMNPVSSLLTGWGLMVIAMMLPKLIIPIQYIYTRSLKRRRLLSSLLFVLGYLAVWMLAGALLLAVIIGLNILLPKSPVPAAVVGIIALIWQFSPVKQQCLNHGHEHRPIATFGSAANRDSLLFGFIHGAWCVGSGWALMLFPMLLSAGHDVAMLAVTFIMISDHLEYPQVPRWRIDFPKKLFRALTAQTLIRFRRILN